MIKAIGFDLGETLIFYEGIPLSWRGLYNDALASFASECGFPATDQVIATGAAVLERYNTRLNPRLEEIPAEKIFSKVLQAWKLPVDGSIDCGLDEFFGFFRRGRSAYTDAELALRQLCKRGFPIGVLTDVPYGMPRRMVLEDLGKMNCLIEALLTSCDVGYRKPHPLGFQQLAGALGVSMNEMAFVGNEEKDIAGSATAGAFPILIDREGRGSQFGQARTIRSLDELPRLIAELG